MMWITTSTVGETGIIPNYLSHQQYYKIPVALIGLLDQVSGIVPITTHRAPVVRGKIYNLAATSFF